MNIVWFREGIMSKRRGTIRDIARETNLSIATVSRAMNGSTSVTDATRNSVLEASRRLNYLPNAAARALTTKRSRTIAAVVPTLEHSIFARFLTSIEKELSRLGYSLVIAVSNSVEEEEMEATRQLLGMGAEGFIFSGLSHHPVLLNLLSQRSIPHVLTSCWSPDPDQITIGYDNAHLATQAASYLYGLGHRNIGVIHGPLAESDRTQARLAGVQQFVRDDVKFRIAECELSVAGGVDAATRLLNQYNDLTSILCFSDIQALGATFRFQQLGLRVPDDISLMGFDNLDWAISNNPPLTTINLPVVEMGRLASAALVKNLDHGSELISVKLDAEIIQRNSTQSIAG